MRRKSHVDPPTDEPPDASFFVFPDSLAPPALPWAKNRYRHTNRTIARDLRSSTEGSDEGISPSAAAAAVAEEEEEAGMPLAAWSIRRLACSTAPSSSATSTRANQRAVSVCTSTPPYPACQAVRVLMHTGSDTHAPSHAALARSCSLVTVRVGDALALPTLKLSDGELPLGAVEDDGWSERGLDMDVFSNPSENPAGAGPHSTGRITPGTPIICSAA